MRLEGERGVHDDAVLVEEPESAAVGVCRHCVSEGGDAGPAAGDGADGVVGGGFDEEAIACGGRGGGGLAVGSIVGEGGRGGGGVPCAAA